MISVYQDGDATVWIPVAAGQHGGLARPFLPFNGLDGVYRFGYKAAPETGSYFHALSQVQQAHRLGERKVFLVNGGRKRDFQKRDKWRHGNAESSPLLGPTLGWVLVPSAALGTVTSGELAHALAGAAEREAVLDTVLSSAVCDDPEQLARESTRLFHAMPGTMPDGQAVPRRISSTVEQFARDAAVVAFVLRQAQGRCECCGAPAPFIRADGLPYLEVHHVRPLAQGGTDRVANAVAVCPNCHRRLHHGADADACRARLYRQVTRLRPE